MRSKFVAGNWKMNGSLAANAALLEALVSGSHGLPAGAMAVLAPFPYLAQCEARLSGSGIRWGAQDLSEHASGAFTGEVAGSMLREFGCSFVLVGHSERRAMHGESSELVGRKAVAAHAVGLTPVVCVGESLAEREAGLTESVVSSQIQVFLDVAGPAVLAAAVIAYEPVWAIGTGKTASPEQAQEVHALVRRVVAAVDAGRASTIQILYGGSVKGSNAASLFAMPDVDGGLVGGASLNGSEFLDICRAAVACGPP